MWDTFFDTARFAEAVDWFRERVPIADDEWASLQRSARERAFLISGVTQLEVVTEVWEALERALESGTSFQDFKKVVRERLASAWGGDNPNRIETIFRTNVQSAYSAGRYEQMTHPDVLGDRPVWMYDAIYDSRTSAICKECDNVRLPADDPWWSTHIPPLHFNCRSVITTLTEQETRDAGGFSRAPTVQADESFGSAPGSGNEWTPDEKDYPPDLWNLFEKSHRAQAKRSASARAA